MFDVFDDCTNAIDSWQHSADMERQSDLYASQNAFNQMQDSIRTDALKRHLEDAEDARRFRAVLAWNGI